MRQHAWPQEKLLLLSGLVDSGIFPLASVSTAGWSLPWLSCLKGRVLLAPMVPASVQAPGILLGESTKAGPGKDSLDLIRQAQL